LLPHTISEIPVYDRVILLMKRGLTVTLIRIQIVYKKII
jgi:hypothetical protein